MAIKSYIKDGNKYFKAEVKMRDSSGKQVYRCRQGLLSERKAQDAEFQLRKEIESIAKQGSSLFWPEWVRTCLEKIKMTSAYSTVYTYEKSLLKWTFQCWAKKSLIEITRSDIHEIVYQSAAELSDGTKKNLLKHIKRTFQIAVEDGHLDRNPAHGMSVKCAETTKLVLTNQETETLLKKANEVGHPFYPIWVAALMTGMRSGELKALLWSDIDLDAKTISVTKQWCNKTGVTPTKSRKNRIVPISADFILFLKEQKLQKQNDNLVLPQPAEWEHGDQAKVIKAFCRTIGITPIKFHDLRATFITNLLSRGVSLARVMAIVGHTEIKTTNVYLRLAGVDVKGATDDLGYKLPQTSEAQIYQISARKR